MQYLAAVLAFIAVIIGITRNTWNQELQRPTLLGWATLAVAAASLLVSIILAYRDRKKLDARARVKAVAERDLREALDSILYPFGSLWMNIAYAPSVRNLEGFKGLHFDESRFYRDAGYMEQKLRDPAFINAWDYFDLRCQPESPGIYPSSTWENFFFDASNRGNEKFELTVTKYSAYLDPAVLLHVHSLQVSEFFRMRLRNLPVLVSANDHMPKYFVSMAFKGPQEQEPYLRFIDRLLVLAKVLPRAERE